MDNRVQAILERIRTLSIRVFGDNLVGIYIHGSLALGCFNWDNSDIDFIVVLKNAPAQEQKEEYITGILKINKDSPPKGLEMSVVLEKYTRRFVYPTPFELHFSNAHLKSCSDNMGTFCRNMHGTDKDLAAHFTIINYACIVIYGKPAEYTFGEVPPEYYFDSIKCDMENAEEEITKNPVYIILNLCRVLAYRYDGLILSKKDGGIWGTEHIDKAYSDIIGKALGAYQYSYSFDPREYKDILISFARYALDLICGR